METFWTNIQANPDAYSDQHVSSLLELMIQQAINTLVDGFVSTWWMKSGELAFMVANYNPNPQDELTTAYNIDYGRWFIFYNIHYYGVGYLD